MDATLTIKKVDGVVRDSIPENDEFITQLISEHLFEEIYSIEYYKRSQEECPFHRGNMIVDIVFKNHTLFCIKLPTETPEETILNYIKPVLDFFDKKGNK